MLPKAQMHKLTVYATKGTEAQTIVKLKNNGTLSPSGRGGFPTALPLLPPPACGGAGGVGTGGGRERLKNFNIYYK